MSLSKDGEQVSDMILYDTGATLTPILESICLKKLLLHGATMSIQGVALAQIISMLPHMYVRISSLWSGDWTGCTF